MMGWIIGIIVFIAVIIVMAIIDFKLGSAYLKKNHRHLTFTKTSGDYLLYHNGNRLFDEMYVDITNAVKQVDVQFFIIKTDDISQQFFDLFKQKAREGVQVRVLVDRLGGYRITKKWREELEQAGVEFRFSEKPHFPYFIFHLNRRNHRKIVVIDGKISYAGGFNIAREYLGKDAEMGDWRDYHLRLTGEVVKNLHMIFLDDWYLAGGGKHAPMPPSDKGSKELLVSPNECGRMEKEFLKMIKAAEEEILIGTPYFIPTRKLMEALKLAAARGVMIKLLCPLKSDHPFVKEAGIPYFRELYQAGGRIRFYDAGFYHAKVFIVDRKQCDIGTANFDLRSLFLNKEVNIFVYDPGFIDHIRNLYLKDFADGLSYDQNWLADRSLGTRINVQIARLLRPLL
ncbi:cardiolipin synthase [Thalassobacillus pellis]|uniref:cardiolipin synthase n=1 Tax=Thalassobacillus pellis TaxID=748008 RepID=UPI0019608B18|nr:cardiolipin synthase [Thalassobacillus pellis]MBM7551802.1 cardiolipin synthase [Thalassobacillus pellis]